MSNWREDDHPRGGDGKWVNSDSMRDEAGQVVMDDWSDDTPGQDSAIGETIVKSKVFHHPDGDVKVSVYRWVEATTDGIPFGPSEHANAAYEQYGADSDGTEPVDGIDYQIAEAVRITSHAGTDTRYGASVYSADSPAAGIQDIMDTDIDWDDYYDPDEHDRDIDLGLKGALDLPRFSLASGGEPVARSWAAGVSQFSECELDTDNNQWWVRHQGSEIRIPAAGVRLSDSLYAAAASARDVETTMHSDDWGDDEEYVEAVRSAHRLRDFMGRDNYDLVICRGNDSTLD